MLEKYFVQPKYTSGGVKQMAESGILKILLVLDILKRTDEYHPINSSQIIKELENSGLKAERKSIGKYIQVLRNEMGYDIILCDNKNLGWYMCDQEFEDYELKMLADSVASAKFLSAANSRKLIKKILKLATKEGEKIIKNTMVLDDSMKITDSMFAVKFDAIMRAIADKKKIAFRYMEWGPGSKLIPKRDGKQYVISPYYLGVWGHEYFVVANTDSYDNVSTYRVEMMDEVETLPYKIRPMSEIEELKGIGKNGRTFVNFIKESVYLKSGEPCRIQISGENNLRKEIMKRFGSNLTFRDQGLDRFIVGIEVATSRGFYEWIAQFGAKMKIEGPGECIEKYKKFLTETLEMY